MYDHRRHFHSDARLVVEYIRGGPISRNSLGAANAIGDLPAFHFGAGANRGENEARSRCWGDTSGAPFARDKGIKGIAEDPIRKLGSADPLVETALGKWAGRLAGCS